MAITNPIQPYTVTFYGDIFTMRVSVELDIDEIISELHKTDDESLREIATGLAVNMLKYKYGWDMVPLCDEIEAVKG